MTQNQRSSQDPYQDINALLVKFSSNPETEAHLSSLLPQITSSFGANKSVIETVEELKRYQQDSDATGKLPNAIPEH